MRNVYKELSCAGVFKTKFLPVSTTSFFVVFDPPVITRASNVVIPISFAFTGRDVFLI